MKRREFLTADALGAGITGQELVSANVEQSVNDVKVQQKRHRLRITAQQYINMGLDRDWVGISHEDGSWSCDDLYGKVQFIAQQPRKSMKSDVVETLLIDVCNVVRVTTFDGYNQYMFETYDFTAYGRMRAFFWKYYKPSDFSITLVIDDGSDPNGDPSAGKLFFPKGLNRKERYV